jgi:hypothetical protein
MHLTGLEASRMPQEPGFLVKAGPLENCGILGRAAQILHNRPVDVAVLDELGPGDRLLLLDEAAPGEIVVSQHLFEACIAD